MPNSLRSYKISNTLAYVFLLLAVLVTPLFVVKNLMNFYILPKQYIFISLTLLSLLFVAVTVILTKRLEYRRSAVDLPVLLILGVGLLSTIFSVTGYESFIGRNEYSLMNFIYLVFLVTFFFLINNCVTTRARWQTMVDALVAASGISAVLFIVKAVFHLDLPAAWFPPVWNFIDGTNSTFGVWLVVGFLVSAGYLIKRDIPIARLLCYFSVAALSLLALVLLSFKILWWLLLVGVILLLLVGVSFLREARLGWLSVLFAVLIVVAVFIVFNSPKLLQANVPPEVSLGMKPSWVVTANTMTSGIKDFLIGSGLGSFSVDFSRFRNASFNADPVAWQLRFSQPFNSIMAIMAEGGVALMLAFIFVVLLVVGHAMVAWLKLRPHNEMKKILNNILENQDKQIEVFLLVVVWLVLSAGLVVVYFNVTLWFLWWLLLGLATTGLFFVDDKIFNVKKLTIEDTPQYNLSFSFIVIIIIAAAVMVGVWGVRLYLAEVKYTIAARSSNYDEAEDNLKQALALRSDVDSYYVGLAQIYLVRATVASRQAKPDLSAVSALVAQAVNYARLATDLSPKSVLIWSNLATTYENAAVIVPGARDWAIKTLIEARDLEPTNPVLWWRLGNSYYLAGQKAEAVKSYQKAIEMKGDYSDAYLGLAVIYEQGGEFDKAVVAYQSALSADSTNIDALFNFGRLLFNRNRGRDRQDAERLWLEAVRLSPGNSNALYSLGLLYESQGDRAAALQYYYKVKDLNPGNNDIVVRIKSLIGAQ